MSDFMSDSEDASSSPSDAQIESTLKRNVARIFKEDRDSVSVSKVRAAVEKDLKLPSGWFRGHDTWKAKSKELTESEFNRLDVQGEEEKEAARPLVKETQRKVNDSTAAKCNSKKRKSPDDGAKAKAKPKPRKKQKVSSEEEDDMSEEDHGDIASDDNSSSPPVKKTTARSKAGTRRSKSATVVDSDDDDEDMPDAPAQKDAPPPNQDDSDDEDERDERVAETESKNPTKANGNESESSMSSLLDEPPAKKKRQKKSDAPKTSKTKAATKTKSAPKKDAKELSPDEEEIKRLQGWLVKCGVRKVWGKELKPFETPKAKIAHLKGMLADVGMTGRYSVDKARQIKEQRELAADLEAVTDFDKKWGQKEEGGRKGKGDVATDLGLDPSLLDGSDDDE